MISESLPGTLEVPRKSQIRESFGPVQRNAMPTAPARAPALISKMVHSIGLRPHPPTPKTAEVAVAFSLGLASSSVRLTALLPCAKKTIASREIIR